MTSETATETLASLRVYGHEVPDPLEGREAEADYWARERALAAMHRAEGAGRRWDWEEAGRQVAAAYRALGSTDPVWGREASGQAWHRGEHPLQVALARLDEEMARG